MVWHEFLSKGNRRPLWRIGEYGDRNQKQDGEIHIVDRRENEHHDDQHQKTAPYDPEETQPVGNSSTKKRCPGGY